MVRKIAKKSPRRLREGINEEYFDKWRERILEDGIRPAIRLMQKAETKLANEKDFSMRSYLLIAQDYLDKANDLFKKFDKEQENMED